MLHGETPPWLARSIVFAITVYWISRAVVSVSHALESLIITVIASFIVACALEVPVDILARRMRRGVATGLVMASLFAVLAALIISIGALVASQVSRLVHRAPSILSSTTSTINSWFSLHIKSASFSHKLSHFDFAHSSLTHSAFSSVSQFAALLMGLLFTYYMVAEGPKFRSHVCSFLPPGSQSEMLRAWDLAIDKAGGYVISRLILALLRAVTASVILLALGVPDAIALGIWFGVIAEFIPIVGTWLAILLPVIVALAYSPAHAIILLIALFLFNQLRNLVFAPKLTRRTVDVHPALAFASVVAAATLFGPLSALLAIPAVATLQAFFSSYMTRHEIAVDHDLLEQQDHDDSEKTSPHPTSSTAPPTQADEEGIDTPDTQAPTPSHKDQEDQTGREDQ